MDLQRFARRQMKMLGFRPKRARTAVGDVLLFLFGGIAGAITGLALAPKSGEELRTELKHRARKMIEQRRMQPPVEPPAQA